MEHAGISDTAVFIGMGDTFQIWPPEAGAAVLGEAIAGASAEFDGVAQNGTPEGER